MAPKFKDSEDLPQGLYILPKEGPPQPLPPGLWNVDEEGNVRSGLDWQKAIEGIQWGKLHELIQNWSKRGSLERIVNLVGMYMLVALIIIVASYLAYQGVVQGQALVGFMGAAIGYLLSRGRVGPAAG